MTGRQCTWLVAPGGYGKTYLLQSYVKTGRRSAIWYNLDESDSDIVTFFDDFSEALETAGRGPLLRLSPDIQDLSRFTRLYFQQLAEQIETPTLLILDDYHRVAAESGLHEAIAAAIGYLPSSIRLVVLSREGPPPAFARAQLHLQMGLIGADDLALTEDEALGIARRAMGEQLTDHAILEARRRVGGWAAGFMVLLGQADPSIVAPESVTTLFHYFEHEVLNLTPDDIRLFLWQTALFQTFSAEMAEHLTGRKHAATILRGLISGNYFLQVSQSPEPVYHYHDLFRDYLLDYGRRHHAEEWRSAALRAAGILSDSDEPDAAANLYAELADWESLGQLINRYGGTAAAAWQPPHAGAMALTAAERVKGSAALAGLLGRLQPAGDQPETGAGAPAAGVYPVCPGWRATRCAARLGRRVSGLLDRIRRYAPVGRLARRTRGPLAWP